MKFTCHCGALLIDQTDNLPHKGHVIPDQAWFGVMEAWDARVIDRLAAKTITADEAARVSREILINAVREMYQCAACGRIYLNDSEHRLQCYRPESDETPKDVLRVGH